VLEQARERAAAAGLTNVQFVERRGHSRMVRPRRSGPPVGPSSNGQCCRFRFQLAELAGLYWSPAVPALMGRIVRLSLSAPRRK
jgi:hypothetical protein